MLDVRDFKAQEAWKFGAKTEAMNAEQRQMFEETLAADQASLEAQREALQAQAGAQLEAAATEPRRKHEPEDTTCECGQPMVRVGEDVSERPDIVPQRLRFARIHAGCSPNRGRRTTGSPHLAP